MYSLLDDARVFVNHGPVQMSIDCRLNGKRNTSIASKVAIEVLEEFSRLSPYTPELKKMRSIQFSENLPWTLKQMIIAVEATEYAELNTLAAVAGSFSEYASFIACELGATKAIINNGGDIALYNIEGDAIKIAIPVNDEQSLKIDITSEQNICGICTSGMSGRSFSKGIATFVTAFAQKASIADACATYIANMTDAEDPNILRCLAEEIDEGTDIRGQIVTVKAENIPEIVKYKATLSGYEVAQSLYKNNLIQGAVVCVGNTIMKVPENIAISF